MFKSTGNCLVFLLLILIPLQSKGQPAEDLPVSKGRYHMGLYVGAYFPSQHTATMYDGYGVDSRGARNDFLNSLMYRRIVYDYGGGYGQPDLIAQAMNVNHDDWSFDESDMPQNMAYSPGVLVGFNSLYKLNKTDGILLNINASQMSINGTFTITITNPPVGIYNPGYSNLRVFGIKGKEQRLILQPGYQKIIGDNESMNFFYEGGGVCTLTKMVSSQILINNLLIDLPGYINQIGYVQPAYQYKLGIGLGLFAGFGVNISSKGKWSAQLLYSPSYENLYYGPDPKFTFQQGIGFRALL